LHHIDQHHIAQVPGSDPVGGGGAHVAGAYDGDLLPSHPNPPVPSPPVLRAASRTVYQFLESPSIDGPRSGKVSPGEGRTLQEKIGKGHHHSEHDGGGERRCGGWSLPNRTWRPWPGPSSNCWRPTGPASSSWPASRRWIRAWRRPSRPRRLGWP